MHNLVKNQVIIVVFLVESEVKNLVPCVLGNVDREGHELLEDREIGSVTSELVEKEQPVVAILFE